MAVVDIRRTVHPKHAKTMDSEAPRRDFLAPGLLADRFNMRGAVMAAGGHDG